MEYVEKLSAESSASPRDLIVGSISHQIKKKGLLLFGVMSVDLKRGGC